MEDFLKYRVAPFIRLDNGCDYHRIRLPLEQMGLDVRELSKIPSEELLNNSRILY